MQELSRTRVDGNIIEKRRAHREHMRSFDRVDGTHGWTRLGSGVLREKKVVCPASTEERRKSENETLLVEVGTKKLLYDKAGRWRIEDSDKTEMEHRRARLTDLSKSVFLPTGFPDSVSSDYLPYQLWTLPTHVTGWVSSSLATGSLLRAVGVGSSALPATAVTAAIKWISKDGVGALGRLVAGGRLGVYVDEDPRLWRLAAEVLMTVGQSLEIATVFFPSHFLLLAGSGNFAIALSKGIAVPAYRVIQQHFARRDNIGEVAAKEESWGVMGQMTGLFTSVGILSALQDAGSWQPILSAWLLFHSIHLSCRYIALRNLHFDSINLPRAQQLIQSHLEGRPIPDPETVSAKERFLTDWMMTSLQIEFGSSLREGAALFSDRGGFEDWVQTYRLESYLLCLRQGVGHVCLKEGGHKGDCLKALWQYLWLKQQLYDTPTVTQIQESLEATNASFPEFLSRAEEARWDVRHLLFRIRPTRVAVPRSPSSRV